MSIDCLTDKLDVVRLAQMQSQIVKKLSRRCAYERSDFFHVALPVPRRVPQLRIVRLHRFLRWSIAESSTRRVDGRYGLRSENDLQTCRLPPLHFKSKVITYSNYGAKHILCRVSATNN